MLIKNDIIELESIVIDVTSKKIQIDSYKTKIKIFTRSRDEFIRRNIHVKSTTIVSLRSKVILIIKVVNLSINRNFLFKLSI